MPTSPRSPTLNKSSEYNKSNTSPSSTSSSTLLQTYTPTTIKALLRQQEQVTNLPVKCLNDDISESEESESEGESEGDEGEETSNTTTLEIDSNSKKNLNQSPLSSAPKINTTSLPQQKEQALNSTSRLPIKHPLFHLGLSSIIPLASYDLKNSESDQNDIKPTPPSTPKIKHESTPRNTRDFRRHQLYESSTARNTNERVIDGNKGGSIIRMCLTGRTGTNPSSSSTTINTQTSKTMKNKRKMDKKQFIESPPLDYSLLSPKLTELAKKLQLELHKISNESNSSKLESLSLTLAIPETSPSIESLTIPTLPPTSPIKPPPPTKPKTQIKSPRNTPYTTYNKHLALRKAHHSKPYYIANNSSLYTEKYFADSQIEKLTRARTLLNADGSLSGFGRGFNLYSGKASVLPLRVDHVVRMSGPYLGHHVSENGLVDRGTKVQKKTWVGEGGKGWTVVGDRGNSGYLRGFDERR